MVVAGALFLSSVPVLASIAAGAFVVWRSSLRVGDWVEIGKVRGEVIEVGVEEVRLVPLNGGKVSIPMFYLLVQPLVHLPQPPALRLHLKLKNAGPVAALLAKVSDLFPEDLGPRVELVGLDSDLVVVCVNFTSLKLEVREKVVHTLVTAVDNNQIELIESKMIEA